MILPRPTTENVSKLDKEIYFEVLRFILEINGLRKSPQKISVEYRCHSICRALYSFLGPDLVGVQDGFFVGLGFVEKEQGMMMEPHFCDHSWLVCRESGVIIDPYPVSFFTLTPIMTVNSESRGIFMHNFYHEDQRVRERVPWKLARKETVALIKILKTLGFNQQAEPIY